MRSRRLLVVAALSDRLVPRDGAWWGSYPGQAPGDVEAREAVYGRRVDILHRYHDWDDLWPTAEEQAYAAGGRILFEGWENRVFGETTSCWAGCAGRTRDRWRGCAQVAQGMYAYLDAVGNVKPRMLGEYGSHDDPALGDKARGSATSRRPCARTCPSSRRWSTSTGWPPRSPATPAPGWPTAHPGPGPGSRSRWRIPG